MYKTFCLKFNLSTIYKKYKYTIYKKHKKALKKNKKEKKSVFFLFFFLVLGWKLYKETYIWLIS